MNNKRKTIGLALGSGGWRGLAHIGVIKELNKNKIPIDYIAGCSAGSLIGGLYAYFENTEKIEKIIDGLNYKSLYKILLEPERHTGIIKGEKLIQFLESYIGETKIEELNIPFKAVCADLFSAKAVELNKGKLSTAIRASSSVPLIFKPVKRNGRFLIDGATAIPVPVTTVREMGADIVIAVNLYNNIFPFKMDYLKKPKLNMAVIGRIAYQMVLYNFSIENIKKADLVINPKIWEGQFNIFKNFINGKRIIQDGQEATKKIIPQLKKLIE